VTNTGQFATRNGHHGCRATSWAMQSSLGSLRLRRKAGIEMFIVNFFEVPLPLMGSLRFSRAQRSATGSNNRLENTWKRTGDSKGLDIRLALRHARYRATKTS
jgi:hypothetical protein